MAHQLACWGLAATWPGLKIQFGMGSNFGADVKSNVRNLIRMVQFVTGFIGVN